MFFFLLFHSSVIHNVRLNSSGVILEDKRQHAKQKSKHAVELTHGSYSDERPHNGFQPQHALEK